MAVKITLGTQGKMHVTFRLKCLSYFYSTQVEPLQCFFFISNLRIQPSALIYWQNFVRIIVKNAKVSEILSDYGMTKGTLPIRKEHKNQRFHGNTVLSNSYSASSCSPRLLNVSEKLCLKFI